MGPNEAALIERLKKDGVRNIHVDWGPKAPGMSREERAGALLAVLDELASGTLEEAEIDENDNLVPVRR